MIGSGSVGGAFQGYSAALSADGTTAIIGGPNDNSYEGAAWVFASASVTAFPEYDKTNLFSVYPNPNNGTFSIRSTQEGTITILNELGQTIQQFNLTYSNNFTKTIENLSNGIYFISGSNDNLLSRQKIVVAR